MMRKHDARLSLRLTISCVRSFRMLAAALLFALLPTATIAQTIINVPPDPAPTNVGADTILNLADGGALGDNFDALDGAIVNISGGHVGQDFAAFDGSIVNISGGDVDVGLNAFSGSTINISGGTVGLNGHPLGGVGRNSLNTVEGSTLNISGGTLGPFAVSYGGAVNITGGAIGHEFGAVYGATVNISGGTIGHSFYVEYATANISGGEFGDSLQVYSYSTVEFSALEFLLDGAPIPGLEDVGDSIVLTQRGGSILSGTFLDGTPFDFVLNPNSVSGQDFFATNATVRLTLVPEPTSVLLFTLGGLTLLTVAIRRRLARCACTTSTKICATTRSPRR